jgi:hypothetical protein
MNRPTLRHTRARTAGALIRIARRLDPPRAPYGEWDHDKGALVIKIPDGNGHSMPLANVNISAGMIQDRRNG